MPRVVQELNEGWHFVGRRMGRAWLAGRRETGSEAHAVTLPHCWNTRDTFAEGVAYHRGAGSYRLRFAAPRAPGPPGGRWWLVAEGFYGTGDVWLNGVCVGEVDGAYLGFRLEVTEPLVGGGANVLAVRLTNRCSRSVLPGIRDPDFILYGGLSGRLRLVHVPAAHLGEERIHLRVEQATEAQAALTIRCPVRGPHGLCLRWSVRDPGGAVVAEAAAVPDGEEHGVRLTWPHPKRWSPDHPALHEAEAVLRTDDGVEVDRWSLRFGVREARFVPDRGFFLNGERLPLRGVNRHEDMPGFGRALPPNLHRRDAAQMRAAGFNFVRLSHYPQHPDFLDACDELGLCVYAELASWKSVRRGAWLRNAQRQLQGLIERDRHRPCVILWGLGNESRDRRAYEALGALAHALDPTRPTIYAENHGYRARRARTLGLTGVWGLNYEFEALDEGRDAAQLRNVVVSECSNLPTTERGDGAREQEQVQLMAGDLARLEGLDHVAGFALWCWADYATLRKKRYRRFSGLVDAWRTPKAAWHLMRALYAREPVLELRGAWGEVGPAERALLLLTNCAEVSLRCGSEPLGTWRGGPMQAVKLPFRREDVVAEGLRGGVAVQARLRWHGAATHLHVAWEEHRDRAAGAGGAFVVEAHDARGVRDASWRGRVAVRTEGDFSWAPWRLDDQLELSGGLARGWGRWRSDAGPARVTVWNPALGQAHSDGGDAGGAL